jgi:hypothetical protein
VLCDRPYDEVVREYLAAQAAAQSQPGNNADVELGDRAEDQRDASAVETLITFMDLGTYTLPFYVVSHFYTHLSIFFRHVQLVFYVLINF